MSTEDLMKPRVMCIANDTSGRFEAGDIFYAEANGDFLINGWKFNPEQYPHLFRKLSWWERLDIKDMPEYVKFDEDRSSITSFGDDIEPEIHIVKKHWATIPLRSQ
jgi:hypothetical protein